MRIRLYFILIIAAVIMAACRRQSPETTTLFAQADSLLFVRPDSAYTLLSRFPETERASWPKADRMRYEVLLADAMNKAYIPFTTDSVLKQVVRYYDRHGSNNFWSSERLISWLRDGRVVTKVSAANAQLRARYLLGCAYRDMGEAPAAINAWQEAVDCADTLSRECDYNTLYRVYGQMADVYVRQRLFNQQLSSAEKYCHYALLSGDTLEFIYALQQKIGALYNNGDTAGVYKTTEEVRRLYLKYGSTQDAAQIYSTAIRVAIENMQYAYAADMMKIYESESNLFDEDGNIRKGREQYYFYKGLYYAGINALDSAEILFRKLLPFHERHIEAYSGLFAIYQQKQIADSAYVYGKLYEQALSGLMEQSKAEAVLQAEGMYNYSRKDQNISSLRKANRRQMVAVGLLFCMVAVIASALYVIIRRKKKKEEKLEHLSRSYLSSVMELTKAQEELVRLKHIAADNLTMIKEKEEIIRNLGAILEEQKKQINEQPEIVRMLKRTKSNIVDHFHEIAKNHKGQPPREANDEEWNQLTDLIRLSYTEFYLFITVEHKLSIKEYKVCILSFLNFTPQEMGILTNSSKYISNVRQKLARKLFNKETAYALNENLSSFNKRK